MKKADLEKKLAQLESINDYLATELQYLDYVTRTIGFPQGVESLKDTARKMLDNTIALNE